MTEATDSSASGPSGESSAAAPGPGLSHVAAGADGREESRMVDVSEKPITARRATARARVRFPAGVLQQVLDGGGPKGPVTEMARAAGVLAAKRTPEWIPLCHVLPLDVVDVRFEPVDEDCLEVRCTVACSGRTGVEMEAMVGAAAAALVVYDMTKGLDKGIEIESVRLLEKSGGRSGHWRL